MLGFAIGHGAASGESRANDAGIILQRGRDDVSPRAEMREQFLVFLGDAAAQDEKIGGKQGFE